MYGIAYGSLPYGDFTEKAGGALTYTLTQSQGTYTLTGKPQTLNSTRTIPASEGTYALTGQTITPGIGMPAAQGAYTVAGQVQSLGVGMPATSGTYSITGKPQSFAVTLSTKPAAGSYSLNGQGQALVFAPAGGATNSQGHKFVNDVGNLSSI